MVKLRLARTGKKHAPAYRIVAIESRTKREGMALEYLGHYNPRTKPSTVVLDKERIAYWLKNGAQPTSTVANMLVKEGLMPKPADKKVYTKQPGRKSQERAQAKQEASAKPEPAAEEKAAE